VTDTAYAKLLPEGIPSWHEPFWDSLQQHRVKVQKCTDCGAFRFVPKEICNKCHSTQYTWEPTKPTGQVYTYTVVHRAPTAAYQAETPYALVHVTMDDGFRMIGVMKNTDPASVRIGQRVKVTYEDVTAEWTLLQFEPA
jgi:uncharacterized OB-fold protein